MEGYFMWLTQPLKVEDVVSLKSLFIDALSHLYSVILDFSYAPQFHCQEFISYNSEGVRLYKDESQSKLVSNEPVV